MASDLSTWQQWMRSKHRQAPQPKCFRWCDCTSYRGFVSSLFIAVMWGDTDVKIVSVWKSLQFPFNACTGVPPLTNAYQHNEIKVQWTLPSIAQWFLFDGRRDVLCRKAVLIDLLALPNNYGNNDGYKQDSENLKQRTTLTSTRHLDPLSSSRVGGDDRHRVTQRSGRTERLGACLAGRAGKTGCVRICCYAIPIVFSTVTR